MDELRFEGAAARVYECETLVIGTGCAGLNAADWLHALGRRDTILVTEGMNMGTSRNTGSDKQTYYKLSVCADDADSVQEMAETLYSGGGVEGDVALCEAAGSLKGFFNLATLGVPFPTNGYGEYVGYKTDHDPRQRATSAGPLTSRYMTEALERSVRERGVPVHDGVQIVELLTEGGRVRGALGVETATGRYRLYRCPNVIAATGGPAMAYRQSVYPESQTGATGMLLRAGAPMRNLAEWQYGLASIKFRWNVSGTYQQVLPRYISIDKDGSERETFEGYFADPFEGVNREFLKGYQWPFDVKKAGGSSMVDVIVHEEVYGKGRRVFMDFTRNPSCIDREGFSGLSDEARAYLSRSGALSGTPIERLRLMNPGAIDLYAAHGVDITREPLEVGVCAQHCNGGAAVDAHWQTPVSGLYVVGEAAGTFGAYRPGGSALNSTQVGSQRAAEHIAESMAAAEREGARPAGANDEGYAAVARRALERVARLAQDALRRKDGLPLEAAIERAQNRMSACAAHIRDAQAMREALSALRGDRVSLSSQAETPRYLKLLDTLDTQAAMLDAMLTSQARYQSHGSGMAVGAAGAPVSPELERYRMLEPLSPEGNAALYTYWNGGECRSEWRPVSPIPARDTWFENVWREYRQRRGQS